MAIMVFVSQHEEISTRAPRFRVAYQGSPPLQPPEANLPTLTNNVVPIIEELDGK